eukprot:1136336-Pelagomonas_calceolata.AAC.2
MSKLGQSGEGLLKRVNPLSLLPGHDNQGIRVARVARVGLPPNQGAYGPPVSVLARPMASTSSVLPVEPEDTTLRVAVLCSICFAWSVAEGDQLGDMRFMGTAQGWILHALPCVQTVQNDGLSARVSDVSLLSAGANLDKSAALNNAEDYLHHVFTTLALVRACTCVGTHSAAKGILPAVSFWRF